jgi:hypothetical protein
MDGGYLFTMHNCLLYVGLAVWMTLQAAFAGSIGVNFLGTVGSTGTALAPAASAGFIPQQNWNNPPVATSQTTPVSLVDDSGNSVAATLTWFVNVTYRASNNASTHPLFDGYLDDTGSAGDGTITVTGIPYSKYDLYLYYGSDGNDRTQYWQINQDAGTRKFGKTNSGTFNGYVEATATSEATAQPATYVHYTELTSPTLLIEWAKLSSNGGIHGFQLVETAVPGAPEIQNRSPENITAFTARLTGTLIDEGDNPPEVTLYYGASDGGTDSNAWAFSASLGTQNVGDICQDVTGLSRATPYFYRYHAVNGTAGDWAPASEMFTTLPVIATVGSQSVTLQESFSVTLQGAIADTGGAIPDVTFYYGISDGGATTNWVGSVALGQRSGPFSLPLEGLASGTTYFFRSRATNTAGDAWAASTGSFTTLIPGLPSLVNHGAIDISAAAARLAGEVLDTGNDSPVVSFFYGSSDAGTAASGWDHVENLGEQGGPFSAFATGLSPETTYFYRARAINAAGEVWTPAPASFTTDSALILPVILNEIHYDPADKTRRSAFIELYNAHTSTVQLADWYFSKGIDYHFPPGSSIDAGQTLVLARDAADFQGVFGFAPFDAWGISTSLSNSGETLTLRNAVGDKIDEVSYQSGFPWPTAAHGLGASMELLHPLIDNDLGGAWRSSTGNPTPGAQNSVFTTNIPPRIRHVSPRSLVTTSGVPVQVTARVTDPDGVSAVTLEYQLVEPGDYIAIDDPRYATSWSSLPMRDDGVGADALAGDDLFTAELPANLMTHRRLIRTRILADDTGAASVQVPYADDAQPNFSIFVYDRVPAWTASEQPGVAPEVTYSPELMESIPTYHLLTTRTDHEDAQHIPNSTAGAYGGAEYLWDGCLVYDGEVYDHIRYRARGGVWRYAMGKNMWKFDFNKTHSFQARDDYGRKYDTTWDKLNFSALIQQQNFLQRGEQGLFEGGGFKLHNLSSNPAPKTHYVHFRIIEHASETGPTPSQYDDDFQGMYMAVEQLDGRFLDAHQLPDGNLYKMEGGTGELNNQGPDQPTDKADLNAFFAYKSAPQTLAWWQDNLDLDDYYNFRFIAWAIHDYDILSNKNYYYYHNPVSAKWQVINWDLDLTWTTTYAPNPRGPLSDYVLAIPEFDLGFRNRSRELVDLLFNPEQTGMVLDEVAQWVHTPGQPSFVDADRAMWDYNPIMTSGLVNSGKAQAGRYYESSLTSDFAGMLQKEKDYVVTRNAWILANILDNDVGIPDTPVISYLGDTNYPVNALTFQSSTFSSASSSFQGMQWRLAEVTEPNAPDFDPLVPRSYEINASYLSPVIYTFTNSLTIPSVDLGVGRRYRARVKMLGDDGQWSHWSEPISFTTGDAFNTPALLANLRITELMFQPIGGSDFEFIELCNTSATLNLQLDGVSFSAGIDYTFPTGTVLEAGAYLVLADTDPTSFRTHYGLAPSIAVHGPFTSGQLNNGGETVRLKTALSGTEIVAFEYSTGRGWYLSAEGPGHSLVPTPTGMQQQQTGGLAYGNNWRPSTYINGSPGESDPVPPAGLIINEMAAHTDFNDPGFPDYDSNDWIELVNTASNAVNFTDWYLSDDRNALDKWALPAGVLPAFQGVLFDEVSGFHVPITNGFGLNKAGEELLLSYLPGGGDRVVDVCLFDGQPNGASLSRIPDRGGHRALAMPSPNQLNLPRMAELSISEVMFNPPQGPTNVDEDASFEFIELFNPATSTIDLFNGDGSFRIRGGSDYDFPAGRFLNGRTSLLVLPFDPTNTVMRTAFLAHYGLLEGAVDLFGPYTGQLSDRSDRITLQVPQAADAPDTNVSWVVTDELIYLDQAPFTPDADGSGMSLQRVSLIAAGNEPTNWEAHTASPGSASFPIYSDNDGDGMDDTWETTHFGDLSRSGLQDFDLDGFLDRHEFVAGTLPGDSSSLLVARIQRHPAGLPFLNLLWPSVEGKSYRIYAANSIHGPFVAIASGLPGQPPWNQQAIDTQGVAYQLFLISVE